MPSNTLLPLFSQYPVIKQQLSPQQFACLPTPVKALPELASNAWVKQDDLTHPDYGGNKIRKLDFVLADIKRQNKKARHNLRSYRHECRCCHCDDVP